MRSEMIDHEPVLINNAHIAILYTQAVAHRGQDVVQNLRLALQQFGGRCEGLIRHEVF